MIDGTDIALAPNESVVYRSGAIVVTTLRLIVPASPVQQRVFARALDEVEGRRQPRPKRDPGDDQSSKRYHLIAEHVWLHSVSAITLSAVTEEHEDGTGSRRSVRYKLGLTIPGAVIPVTVPSREDADALVGAVNQAVARTVAGRQ